METFTPLQRITIPTLTVLAVLLREDERWFGLRIAEKTGLRTASVYPILTRLERSGWAASVWERSRAPGAARKYYVLTDQGRESARFALQDHETETARRTRLNSLIARVRT